MEKIVRARSVAFTGYRRAKIERCANPLSPLEIEERCYEAVEMLFESGYNTFLSGGAEGFDLLAAKAVLRHKERGLDIKLVMVLPFASQEARYSYEDKELYRYVCEKADKVITLFDRFEHNYQFLKRNDFLIENSTCLICFYDGQRGGTMYTVGRAEKAGYPIINIAQNI